MQTFQSSRTAGLRKYFALFYAKALRKQLHEPERCLCHLRTIETAAAGLYLAWPHGRLFSDTLFCVIGLRVQHILRVSEAATLQRPPQGFLAPELLTVAQRRL